MVPLGSLVDVVYKGQNDRGLDKLVYFVIGLSLRQMTMILRVVVWTTFELKSGGFVLNTYLFLIDDSTMF